LTVQHYLGVFIVRYIVALLASAVVSSPAIAENFDLKCSGYSRETAPGTGARKPWAATFHIDIGNSAYCVDDCTRSDAMKITPTWLELLRPPSKGTSTDMLISRSNGKVVWVFSDPDYRYPATLEAICEKAPYSGKPVVKF
jgi:hypothetical protein